MKEIGLLNREISDVITRLGHGDELCICDAGFAIPDTVRNIDISLKDNHPSLIEVLEEILRYFSVEKLIIAKETKKINPSMFKKIVKQFDDKIEVIIISHLEFKKKAQNIKAIIRTGDFTAYNNIILVSGVEEKRWSCEKNDK